jgi:UrcA family protein
MSIKITAAAGLVLAALAAPAVAQVAADDITVASRPATRQVAVRASDLNIADSRGRATLEKRLAAAANEACSADLLYTTGARSDVRRCREAALANAWRQVDNRQTGGVTAIGGN